MTSKVYFSSDFLQFFKDLAANNHKDWFDENRQRYEQEVREPFKEFVQDVIDALAKQDDQFKSLEAKDCIFRINRDIRFSKDKTPYKLMVSAVVAPGGKKSRAINGVYFEFSPEHVRAYGGIYEIDKDDLYEVREGIINNLAEFKKLYNAKDFRNLYGEILGEKNKIIPQEFREKAESEPLVYNKQWYFYTEFPAELVTSATLLDAILNSYHVARPIENFLNGFIPK